MPNKLVKQIKKEPLLFGGIAIGIGVILYMVYKSNAGNDTGQGFAPADMSSLKQQSPYEINLFSMTPPSNTTPVTQPPMKPGKDHDDDNHHGHPKPKPHPKPAPKPGGGVGNKKATGQPIIGVGVPGSPGKLHPMPIISHTQMHSSQETGVKGTGANGNKIVANPPHIIVGPFRPLPQGNLKNPHNGTLISPPVLPLPKSKGAGMPPIQPGVGYIFQGPSGVTHFRSPGGLSLSRIAQGLGMTWNDIYAIPNNQKLLGSMDYIHARNYVPGRGVILTIPKTPSKGKIGYIA